jgi:hypothetical protein
VTFDEMEAALREHLEALPPAARAELIHVLRLPDFERADRIGESWGHPETRTFGELLIDLEEDKAYKAVVRGAAQGDGAGTLSRRSNPSSSPNELTLNETQGTLWRWAACEQCGERQWARAVKATAWKCSACQARNYERLVTLPQATMFGTDLPESGSKGTFSFYKAGVQ